MNKRGVEIEAIGKVLGHSPRNLNVTLDYIDVSEKQMTKAFELAF
ncbi:hypothetical protein MACH09_47170 [Vibrio sp. MACH09]|nr:hypothetical protein MACH09_47170 [Vibrio sp. MACH09]